MLSKYTCSTFRYLPKEDKWKQKENKCLFKDLHTNAYTIFICDSLKLETTLMSIYQQMDRQIAVRLPMEYCQKGTDYW